MGYMARDTMRRILFIKVFKVKEKYNKNVLKSIIELLLFLSILFGVFSSITYLFRHNDREAEHINGIKNVKDLDVVCVGGSATFVYWEPFKAWHEYGMTSYDFATDSSRPAVTLGCVREVIDKANPDLIVIDVRSYADDRVSMETIDEAEAGIRNVTDSMDLGIERVKTLCEVMNYYDVSFFNAEVDIWSYFFDISKYHTNTPKLGVPESWRHLNNNYITRYNGFEFITSKLHEYLETPTNYITEDVSDIGIKEEENLYELMDYLNKQNVEALFVASPIPVTKEDQMRYNRISDIVETKGFRFLNTNNYYEEMGIDFSRDFYNSGHVNVYGAEKYTLFLAKYIKENYTILDHRNERGFELWDENYDIACIQEEELKTEINKKIEEEKNAYSLGMELKSIDSFEDWINRANNRNYTVIYVSKNCKSSFFTPWNTVDGENIIRIFDGNEMIGETNGVIDEDYSTTIGTKELLLVTNNGNDAKITIGEIRVDLIEDGSYIVVFDNNYNVIHDCIMLDNNGKLRHLDV